MPIRQKLVTMIMLNSGAVLLLTCIAFFAYEFYTFRGTLVQQLSTLGQIVATNSTAALAFDDPKEAIEILNALKAEKNIEAASLYTRDGKLFSKYPATLSIQDVPISPQGHGYNFKDSHLEGFQPVIQGTKQLGTLYIRSDLRAITERFQLYGIIVVLIIASSSLLAFLLSRIMQKGISNPILLLAATAKTISYNKDYSVRVVKRSNDEVGSLTDAFNHMLIQIEEQNHTLNEFNKRLGQKVSELQKSNYDLDSFIYTASHDLKAPITNIEGLVNSLKDELGQLNNGSIEELLGMMNFSIQKFKNTIIDLTEISKIQKGIETEVDDIDIAELLEEILFNSKNILASEDPEFIIELYGCKELKFSRKNLRSILYNLINNAIKYHSPDRKPVITIRTEIIDGYCLIRVKDNGLGLAPYQQEKVFSMFKRFHDHVEGTGIGLYIVKRIVENAGGRIEVESEKDKGSEFKVYLKLD